MRYVPVGKQNSTDWIVEIVFNMCDSSIVCKFVTATDHGQWWVILSESLPPRFVCIQNARGLHRFATKYGYMDKNDCVSYKSAQYGVVNSNKEVFIDPTLVKIAKSIEHVYAPGIPQRTVNSGLCWYSALCFACFFCRQMRDIFKTYSHDSIMNRLIDSCLYHPKDAEALRHHLFHQYAIGDDPSQNPEEDGQNGLSEFIVLCAKLKIPIVRLFAPNLSELTEDVMDKKGRTFKVTVPTFGEPSFLFVRCFRTRWRPKLRIFHGGMKFKLASVMIGSEHCGHQIGASTCDMHVCRWACADSDACREGIGPIFWKVKRHEYESVDEYIERWWDIWGKMIPVTLFNSDSFCDFSPHNRSTCTLEHKMKNSKCTNFNAGVVNSDFIYVCEP